VQAKQLAVSGRIFSIESARHPSKGNIVRLKVNFLPEIITLAKEVCSPLPLSTVYISNWCIPPFHSQVMFGCS